MSMYPYLLKCEGEYKIKYIEKSVAKNMMISIFIRKVKCRVYIYVMIENSGKYTIGWL